MSADNGIYILKTKDQCRVIHAQAIDNLWWSFLPSNERSKEPVSTRLVEYYGDSRYTRNIETAFRVAHAMSKGYMILEYGIQVITVNKTWKQILAEAKELAIREIEAIKLSNIDYYKYEIPKLEKIAEMAA